MGTIPARRIRILCTAPAREKARYVLYWMSAARRTTWNFGLQRAVERAIEFKKPLVILETLACGRRWDSERFHRFVLDGMADNAKRLERKRVFYHPYIANSLKVERDVAMAFTSEACLVVADDSPIHEVPNALRVISRRADRLFEVVDSNGLFPLRAADRVFPTAYSFRRFLQQELPGHLADRPLKDPLARRRLPRVAGLPRSLVQKFPAISEPLLVGDDGLTGLSIDHRVSPVKMRGGSSAAGKCLRDFLEEKLERYEAHRNEPEEDVTSGLSPYLHYGHISAHQIFSEIVNREEWSPDDLSGKATGSRKGWWGLRTDAEAFLDQLVTWRELGYNMAWQREDYDTYESLPDWAQETLGQHGADYRPHTYSFDEFDGANTHDRLWNAAQTQLKSEGRLHNYLRMLWGKKILEWSPSPEEAAEIMIELNNKYALDGQDPNSYSGIFWILGRYDRPWGPERSIFGKIRYMSSDSTARKVRVKQYIQRYTP